MTTSWPLLLRTARRMVRLTQEDFAADFGRSQSLVAQWETGRKPLPPAVRRRVLDIIGGYYHRRPEYGALLARAVASPLPVTLYRQGMVVQAGNPVILQIWREHGVDLVGSSILPLYRQNLRLSEMADPYFLPMLHGTAEVLAVSFNDRSVLIPTSIVRRTAQVYRMGEGRLLMFEEQFLRDDGCTALPPADLRILTMDDAGADGIPSNAE